MDKLQQVISTILNSPMEEKEKLVWINKFNSITDPTEFSNMLEEMAKYFDSFAEKYEDEVRLYDKYLGILEKFQIELAQAQEKQIPLPASVASLTGQQIAGSSVPTTSGTVQTGQASPAISNQQSIPASISPVSATPAGVQSHPVQSVSSVTSPVPTPPVNNSTSVEPSTFVDELEQVQKTINQLKNQAVGTAPPATISL